MNRRKALLVGGASLATAAGGGFWLSRHRSARAVMIFPDTTSSSPTPSPQPSAEVLAEPTPVPTVTVDTTAWYSWALMDRRTEQLVGSANSTELNYTASVMKAWLAADYLRLAAEAGKKPSASKLSGLSIMIRDSDNAQGRATFDELGRSAAVTRMNTICGLDGAQAGDGLARTKMSAQDMCRMAHCLGTGVAAGPVWTDWLLNEMRLVRGYGNFGIRKAFPTPVQSTIAVKNGWQSWSNTLQWTVNCLALTDSWAMSVLTRYPANRGLDDGMRLTQQVASQLMTTAHLA